MKYLFIDGNNLACRAAFANPELKNSRGISTGVHFGMFQSLINLKQAYPEHQFLMVWDNKSKRRVEEAEKAVKEGIIPSGYKENRRQEPMPQPLQDFYQQSPYLQRGIGQTGIPQIRLDGFEADDVIASYSKALRDENEVVIATTDRDFYQTLHDNVTLWDGMKQQLTRKKVWVQQMGIEPQQAIDVGAFEGDAGDNIHGCPSIGEKTALEIVKEFGSWQKAIAEYHKKYDSLRVQFPDLNAQELEKLMAIKTKAGKTKYEEVNIHLPFTGVIMAMEEKKVKLPKTELMALVFERRVALAYSLKKMDDDIGNLPPVSQQSCQVDKIIEYFEYYDIQSLQDSISVFK